MQKGGTELIQIMVRIHDWELELTTPMARNASFHYPTTWVTIDMYLNMVEVCLLVAECLLTGLPAAFKCMWQVWYHILPSITECANL
jgi:hypothetical protein